MTFLTCRRSRRRQSQQYHLSTRWTWMCHTRNKTRTRSLPTLTGWHSWHTSPRVHRAHCYRSVHSAGWCASCSSMIIFCNTTRLTPVLNVRRSWQWSEHCFFGTVFFSSSACLSSCSSNLHSYARPVPWSVSPPGGQYSQRSRVDLTFTIIIPNKNQPINT